MAVRVRLRAERDPAMELASDAVLIGAPAEDYGSSERDYEVTPTAAGQVLPTAGKRMARDLAVRGVPVVSVSNEQGGRTVTIL